MPITFTPAPPHALVGPGISVSVQTSLSSVPAGSVWDIQFWTSGLELMVVEFQGPAAGTTAILNPYVSKTHFNSTQSYYPKSGDAIDVLTELINGSSVIDSGTGSATWDATVGLGEQAYLIAQQAVTGGGLTTGQAAQLATASTDSATLESQMTGLIDTTLPSLQSVIDSILTGITATITTTAGAVGYPLGLLLSGHLLDLITTISLTSGTTCNPVDADISGSIYFGLQIGIDTYPAWFDLTGLDSAYSPAAFAILTLTRGGYVVLRKPIHTLTDTVYPLPGAPVFALELDLPVLPLGYHVHVDWADGVCGHVLALKLP